MLLKEISKIEIIIVNFDFNDEKLMKGKLITPPCLKENNVIEKVDGYLPLNSDSRYIVNKGDLLIKRLNPSYVSYYDQNDSTQLFNNIIKISVNSSFNAKYVAYLIEKNISKVIIGTVISILNRSIISEIEIPEIDFYKQIAIGELWYLNKIRQQLYCDLQHKQQRLENYNIYKFLNNLGGKQNGRN